MASWITQEQELKNNYAGNQGLASSWPSGLYSWFWLLLDVYQNAE
jgi:hypothetical protein